MSDQSQKTGEYIKIPIQDFIVTSELFVDLYIQLAEGKVVQIAKVGDLIEDGRIKNYESGGVTHLLIKAKDHSKYMAKGMEFAGIAINNAELALSKRETHLTQLASNVFHEIEQIGLTKEAYGHAHIVAGGTISLCQGKADLFELILHFSKLDSVYSHSVAVSIVSVMIGYELNWKSLIIEKLALGGLLHDIGKQELPPHLLKKPRALMTSQEVIEYESHCYRGMQILRSLPVIPDDVVSIAYEHHENSLGLGFPRKIKQMYINPLARIVGLADEFCHLVMPDSKLNQRSPQDAMTYIRKILGQPFWPDAFKALKNLLPNLETKTSA